MRIRWKLLLLLMGIAIVPLAVVGAIDLHKTNQLGRKLAIDFRTRLAEDARRTLSHHVSTHRTVLDRDMRMIELIVRRQAREAALALAAPPTRPTPPRRAAAPGAPKGAEPAPPAGFYASADYGDPSRRPPAVLEDPRYYTLDDAGRRRPLPVTFDDVVVNVAAGVSAGPGEADATADALRLAPLAPFLREMRASSRSLLVWQYAATDTGVLVSYPGHGGYPPEYDHRRRDWYRFGRQAKDVLWTTPFTDVTTGRLIMSAVLPIRMPDGQVVGVTGVDFYLTDVLGEVELPAAWAAHAQIMIVSLTAFGAADGAVRPLVIATQEYQRERMNWREQLDLSVLESPDADELARLVADLADARAGVREFRSCGKEGDCRPALWAYGPLLPEQGAPPALVVVVPTAVVVGPARAAEQTVLGVVGDLAAIIAAALAVMVAIVALVAWRGARVVTRPVSDLVEATDRVAAGDFAARVVRRSGDEFQHLAERFNEMVPRLEDQIRVRASLDLAMQVQQSLLPAAPPHVAGLDVAGMSIYCDETGGDYYDFVHLDEIDERRLAVVIGDVVGHGIAAAILMATARALWRSRIAHPGGLAEVITEVNRHLVLDRMEGRFMTMMCMVIDTARRSVTWVGAGHDPVILYDPEKDAFDHLEGVDIPLGVEADWSYHEHVREDLRTGQVLVEGTDGIWEAPNESGEMFGKERLLEVVRAHASETAAGISRAITEELARFRGVAPQRDDVTLVVVKVSDGATEGG